MRKIILSGNIIEIYDMSNNVVGIGGYKEISDLEQKEKNYKQQSIKRRNNVRRLTCANFNDGDKFFTLTFAKNETDIRKCNKELKKFVKRLKYNYNLENFKYLAVIEFQERGAIHYHMICNLPYIKQEKLQELWGHGFVWINQIKNVDNVGAYIVKYMNKDLSDVRLQGEKAYLYSRNLKKPLEITNTKNENRDLFLFYNNMVEKKIKNIAPSYESEYENEFLGKTKYRQYKF